MAIFDPEVERLATQGGGGADWSSSTIDGGNAITAAAAILRQLERLTCATDAAAAKTTSGSRAEGLAQGQGRRSNGHRVFSSPSERLTAVAEEQESAGKAELQAVGQLASIVRMRILAALSSSNDAREDSASNGCSVGSDIAPGEEGSIEALSVRARCGDWVQSLPAAAIVALSELASPVRHRMLISKKLRRPN